METSTLVGLIHHCLLDTFKPTWLIGVGHLQWLSVASAHSQSQSQPVQTELLPLCSLLSAPNTDAMGGPQLPSYIRDEKNSGADGQAGHGTGKAAETPQLWAAYWVCPSMENKSFCLSYQGNIFVSSSQTTPPNYGPNRVTVTLAVVVYKLHPSEALVESLLR